MSGCPQENLLGERGRGYANFLRILDEGRIAIAALSVGAAQGCVDESVKYAKEREAFGAAIGSYQAIAFKIARDGGPRPRGPHRLLRRRGADAGAASRSRRPPSVANLVASEAAMDNSRDATQIFGGYGFMNEYSVARHYRDCKILEIGEGTTGSAADADRDGSSDCDRGAPSALSSSAVCGSRSSKPGCCTGTGRAAPSPRRTTCCSPR